MTSATDPRRQTRDNQPPDLWSESGAFARHFPGYEPRAQQQQMYEAVAETLERGGHLIVEAGTGTGKSMAYIAPIILLAVEQPDLKFVISTNTINLQQQLAEKDVPNTLEALVKAGLVEPGQFTYTVLKGRGNYLCRNNYDTFIQQHAGRGWEPADRLVETIENWRTETGDRSEINLRQDQLLPWNMMSASRHSACPFFQNKSQDERDQCFLRNARQKAQDANLVVTNHSLLLADLANNEVQLGHTTHIVIDESHHLEEEASNQFGWKITQDDGKNAIEEILDDPVLNEAARSAAAAWREYWNRLSECAETPRYDDETVTRPIDRRLRNTYEWHLAMQASQELMLAMGNLQDGIVSEINRSTAQQDPQRETALRNVNESLNDVKERIRELMDAHDPLKVRWLERTQRHGATVHSIPLNVADTLRQMLFNRKTATVLTSATLATGDRDFSLIRNRTGFPDQGRDLALESPFDYRRQALFMSPVDMPSPHEEDFNDAVADCLSSLCDALDGRTLALFTSHAALHGTAKRIRPALDAKGISVMAQGRDGTPGEILDNFRNNPRSVILGTASFWEGVDLSHDVLKAVVICRLPFPVPTDPIIKARSDTFKDAFNEYHTPMAILRFRQGCGRLIRNKHSHGAIIVLDARIRNKRYGMKFFQSLPKCRTAKSYMHNIGKLAGRWAEDAPVAE